MIVAAITITMMTTPTTGEYVTARGGLRIRAEPSIWSEELGVLPFAEEVHGTVTAGWLKTEDGYLKTDYLSEDNPLDEYTAMGSWLTTAYTHTGCNTASGAYPTAGYTVACNSLPIGTELYISGVGFRTVQDRGPVSMPGEWLDIFMDGYSECVVFGEQYHEVWVKKTP